MDDYYQLTIPKQLKEAAQIFLLGESDLVQAQGTSESIKFIAMLKQSKTSRWNTLRQVISQLKRISLLCQQVVLYHRLIPLKKYSL
jgi:hypothetical protein